MIDASYVKDGATVIDVGIHRDANNKLCGDVDFASGGTGGWCHHTSSGRRRTDDDRDADE